MTTANDILNHFGLAGGTASKREVLAAWNAADDEGTIQASDALRLFGPGAPERHTCMSLRTALCYLGCVETQKHDAI